MKVETVVLDTNVLISAAINRNGNPAQCLEYVLRYGRPLFSRETFAELRSRLFLPRLDRFIGEEDWAAFLQDLYFAADWVTINNQIIECRDPRDDMFLETAMNGQADCMVSGDGDLLALNPFRGLPILSPAEFVMNFGL